MERTKFNVSKDREKRTYEGILFDSVMELRYYRDVILPQMRSGRIKYCERQKQYVLQPKFHNGNKWVQPILYDADFYIEYDDGSNEVIDIKGYADSTARLKRKMFWYVYPELTYRWVGYSKIDGNEENGGWCEFEYINEQRAQRKKQKRILKEQKENEDGERD